MKSTESKYKSDEVLNRSIDDIYTECKCNYESCLNKFQNMKKSPYSYHAMKTEPLFIPKRNMTLLKGELTNCKEKNEFLQRRPYNAKAALKFSDILETHPIEYAIQDSIVGELLSDLNNLDRIQQATTEGVCKQLEREPVKIPHALSLPESDSETDDEPKKHVSEEEKEEVESFTDDEEDSDDEFRIVPFSVSITTKVAPANEYDSISKDTVEELSNIKDLIKTCEIKEKLDNFHTTSPTNQNVVNINKSQDFSNQNFDLTKTEQNNKALPSKSFNFSIPSTKYESRESKNFPLKKHRVVRRSYSAQTLPKTTNTSIKTRPKSAVVQNANRKRVVPNVINFHTSEVLVGHSLSVSKQAMETFTYIRYLEEKEKEEREEMSYFYKQNPETPPSSPTKTATTIGSRKIPNRTINRRCQSELDSMVVRNSLHAKSNGSIASIQAITQGVLDLISEPLSQGNNIGNGSSSSCMVNDYLGDVKSSFRLSLKEAKYDIHQMEKSLSSLVDYDDVTSPDDVTPSEILEPEIMKKNISKIEDQFPKINSKKLDIQPMIDIMGKEKGDENLTAQLNDFSHDKWVTVIDKTIQEKQNVKEEEKYIWQKMIKHEPLSKKEKQQKQKKKIYIKTKKKSTNNNSSSKIDLIDVKTNDLISNEKNRYKDIQLIRPTKQVQNTVRATSATINKHTNKEEITPGTQSLYTRNAKKRNISSAPCQRRKEIEVDDHPMQNSINSTRSISTRSLTATQRKFPESSHKPSTVVNVNNTRSNYVLNITKKKEEPINPTVTNLVPKCTTTTTTEKTNTNTSILSSPQIYFSPKKPETKNKRRRAFIRRKPPVTMVSKVKEMTADVPKDEHHSLEVKPRPMVRSQSESDVVERQKKVRFELNNKVDCRTKSASVKKADLDTYFHERKTLDEIVSSECSDILSKLKNNDINVSMETLKRALIKPFERTQNLNDGHYTLPRSDSRLLGRSEIPSEN